MSTPAIRLSVTKEVEKALRAAKRRYPALSDPEILKVGLSKIVTEYDDAFNHDERDEISRGAAYSVGQDYLEDTSEDIYSYETGTKVHFS